MGGRQVRTGPEFGNIYDHFSVTYTYDNGVPLISNTRQMPGCKGEMSAMVIGAWLIAFALAAWMAIRQRDLAQLFVPGVTYTAFGVFELIAVVWHWPQVSSKDPWTWVYVSVLVAITVTGAYGWRAARPHGRSGRGTRISVSSGR